MPAASNALRRREHCEGDSPILSASWPFVRLPSDCRASSSLRSKASTEIACMDGLTGARTVQINRVTNDRMHALRGGTAVTLHSDRFQRKVLAMGPFPHDAPPATISAENPAGTDGFEFVEFAHPEPDRLSTLFECMGYS